MDDIRDQNEVERRINEVLGQEGLTAGEEDVLAELEQLEEEVRLDEEKRNGEKEQVIELPIVPNTPLPVVKEPKPTITKVAVAS
jgi:3-deoxy-D-manno-octulosonate 8-phosphate phosphatase KdsC-like HAD superfamily phosphatase